MDETQQELLEKMRKLLAMARSAPTPAEARAYVQAEIEIGKIYTANLESARPRGSTEPK